MSTFMLYLVLLKATVTTFSGLASLPVLRQDLIVTRHVLSDEQLNTAIVVTRTTPGPVGLYIVSVGYFVAGVPGAVAGWAAMITPAVLIIPLVHYVGRRAEHPKIKNVLRAVVLSSAGLLWAATLPIAQATVTTPISLALFVCSLAVLATRRVESLWVILGAAALQLGATSIGMVSGL